jgi:hypothetical protein
MQVRENSYVQRRFLVGVHATIIADILTSGPRKFTDIIAADGAPSAHQEPRSNTVRVEAMPAVPDPRRGRQGLLADRAHRIGHRDPRLHGTRNLSR